MTLLAIPNVSEGRRDDLVARFTRAAVSAGGAVLDVHSDVAHNRSVLTMAAGEDDLIEACVRLAEATMEIDLRHHHGVHPRVGGLDVCPFVPHGSTTMESAVGAARTTARRIGHELSLPVFLYGKASDRVETRDLPRLRVGGLEGLTRRVAEGLEPDAGPRRVDPTHGVVCVGARGPLIAFNVWLDASLEAAKQIAAQTRSATVRTLGLEIAAGVTQVSMNLVDPHRTNLQDAFDSVAAAAEAAGIDIRAAEIVGLVEERFLPAPDTTVARLLMEPGHSVERALKLVP